MIEKSQSIFFILLFLLEFNNINLVIKYFDEFIKDLKDKKADSNATILFNWHESSKKPKNEEKNF
jgi:hypothetical protein